MARDERALAVIAAAFNGGAMACVIVMFLGPLLKWPAPDVWGLAAVALFLPGALAFVIWFLHHMEALGAVTGVPISRPSQFGLFLAPIPFGGIMAVYLFSLQLAAAREVRGLRGVDPILLAVALTLVSPAGLLWAQWEMERITGPVVPPRDPADGAAA